jgi:glucose-6-phosphate 1-epimerase
MIIDSRWQGLPTLLIDTPLARCEIGLQGAQVLSFIPAQDGRDLLWCSPARLQPGRPVRGGIPVCWPWFSRQGQVPSAVQHGFARRMPWALRHARESADGTVQVVLELVAPRGGWPQSDWPAACTAQLQLEIGSALTVRLISRNDSDTPVRLTQALHTYLRVGDVHHARLHGLEGRDYLDNLQGLARFTQHAPWQFDEACDRIYLETASEHRIEDPLLQRTIRITTQGSGSTVVWNAGAPGYAALGDVPAHAWPGYLCVEAANCEPHDPVILEPGARAELVQILSAD